MILETFFEKFDLFVNMPNAVGKLRKLVRRLAVEGRLVSQDTNDEPAKELVARIVAALPKKKSENPFLENIEPSITDKSKYNLPSGWTWLPLGHVGVWATGCGFPTIYQGGIDREFLFCKVSDMNLPGNEAEIHTTVHSIDADVMKKIRARANPVGTVIFPKIGGAIATHKRRLVIKPTIIDNNCSGIQPIGLTDHRWLLLFMRTLDLTKYQSGTSVPAVSQGSLDPIRIGLPPLIEQKRIIAKVDELMSLCDRLEVQQQAREMRHGTLAHASLARFADAPTPANLSFLFHPSYGISPADLRKSILAVALKGKLIPQDLNDEPANEFLLRTMARHAQSSNDSKSRREKGTAKIVDDEIPFSIPDSWAWCRLETIADKITDGEHLSPMKTVSGMPLLTATHVTARGLTLNNPQYISVEDGFKSRQRCDPKREDILICSRGTIGRCAVVETDEVFCLMGSVILVRFPVESSSRYFNYFFSTDLAQTEMRGMSGATAVQALYLKDIRQSLVPIPPLSEQRRIVAKVDQLMALVDQLETNRSAVHVQSAALLDALVAELTQTS